MPKLLVVEDDEYLSTMIVDRLVLDNFTVDLCANGTDGLNSLSTNQYDLAILDWNLPGLGGIEIVERYRRALGTTPILMLTGRNAVGEKVAGLAAGADDYLTKPFHMSELQARVRALLRRPSAYTPELISIGPHLVLDTKACVLRKDNQPLHLMPKEFALLEFFARHPHEVFSPETIIQRVWNSDATGGLESVRSCVKRLRSKIDDDGAEGSLIENVFGVGYRFRLPSSNE